MSGEVNPGGAERLRIGTDASEEVVRPRSGAEGRVEHNSRQSVVFDRIADQFLKPLPNDVVERTEQIVAAGAIRQGDRVLDVGTGTGALIPHLLRYRPGMVVACDLSLEMLRRARQRYGRDVHFVRADLLDLPVSLGPFQRVFCNAVFGNLYDQEEALRAVHRLLEPRGLLVISHPMGRGFVNSLRQMTPDIVRHPLPDRRLLADMCARAGFRLVSFTDEPDLYVAVTERQTSVQLGRCA